VTSLPSRPNIILLILDTLRAKNMSCYEYPLRTTPHLDAFASENTLFLRAFSPATWTVPSHASMLSGLYLSQHRIENIQMTRRFHPDIVTLPVALRSVGIIRWLSLRICFSAPTITLMSSMPLLKPVKSHDLIRLFAA